MQLLDGGWVYSPTDLVARMDCDHRTALDLALRAGLLPVEPGEADGMHVLAGKHGGAHERRVLELLRARHETVVEIDQPANSRAALRAAAAQTAEALAAGVDVVFQATFFDEHFRGHADFVIRGADGYEVYDTKLARSAKPGALLQLAAYSEQLERLGYPLPRQLHVWLGNDEIVSRSVDDVLPVLHRVRADLLTQLANGPVIPPRIWGDRRSACGSCHWSEVCGQGRDDDRDLSLVAGMRGDQSARLREAGLVTIEQLGAAPDSARPDTMGVATFERLRAQARLQVTQDATRTSADPVGKVTSEYFSSDGVRLLPRSSVGDVWFDMEGDPFAEGGAGLEYLFGYVTIDQDGEDNPLFTPIWAHSPQAEKAAFEQFVDAMEARLAHWPDMHIYHYANYERTALTRLAGRHGTREAVIDEWLRHGVLVDLMKVFKGSFRISQRSYSIKKLEPLYDLVRTEDITTAGDSVVDYEAYLELTAAKEHIAAQAKLDAIGEYNEVDCVSTLKLDRWMRTHLQRARSGEAPAEWDSRAAVRTDERSPVDAGAGAGAGVGAGAGAGVGDNAGPAGDEHGSDHGHTVYDALLDGVPESATERTAEQQARAMVHAAVDFFDREAKPQWWEHFARLDAPAEDWEPDRDVLVVDAGTAEPWEAKRSNYHRTLQVTVREGDWREYQPGDEVYLIYDQPTAAMKTGSTTGRGWTEAKVESQQGNVIRIKPERVPMTDAPPAELPAAIFPQATVRNGALVEQVRAFADEWLARAPQAPDSAVTDLLLRRPPRLHGGGELPLSGDETADITAAVEALDSSYLAVQGPPGSGKTYQAAQVIRSLVAAGRRVGVVSQSHKAVENLLDTALALGVPPDHIAKKPKTGFGTRKPYHHAKIDDWLTFHTGGAAVGGTAWTFCSSSLADQLPLDLLIIDEAGQYSLGYTISLWRSARNILLVGDPQQLPQVSQGTHPEPVDVAALSWLVDGEPVLPDRFGYFLDQTRRMQSDLTAAVSRLSYDRRLVSHPDADKRLLEDVTPGVHPVAVVHRDRTVLAPEEVDAVVQLVQRHVGATWTDGPDTRPLAQRDVMVVAPYNAQVDAIRRALRSVGLTDVPVGTVDKFQGQQAPVVIVSMTTSSRDDVPRGLGFVLSRNRLNVAISRAQWASYVVYSPALADHSPTSSPELVQLGAFLGVVEVMGEKPNAD
ncbi:MAG: TM0106 family RecB-like putative nuclease [Candidatus Nanopelagicales bacterium]